MGLTFRVLQQRLKQARNGLLMLWLNKLRCNLAERNKNECALGQSWVGNVKAILADNQISYQKDIQIQRTRPILKAACPVTAKLALQGQQCIEQRMRG